MLQKPQPQSPLVRANRFGLDDKERLLMIHQGIFRNNIKEFAEKVMPKMREKKNYAR